MSATRTARITFNEIVRCARIVNAETSSVRELEPMTLKQKPIVFRPRGNILALNNKSLFTMECTFTTNQAMQNHDKSFIENETKCNVASKISVKILRNWYIDINMRVYHEDTKCVYRTSVISEINGNIITTASGSVYELGQMDPLIQKRLDHICMDETDPLKEEYIPYLTNAASDTYSLIL